jgi:hypothetical protein
MIAFLGARLRFSTLEYDFVRLCLPDGWREKRSADFSSITPDLQCSMVGFADFTQVQIQPPQPLHNSLR